MIIDQNADQNVDQNYVVYHLHTDLSLLDSTTKYTDYIDRAAELNMSAICFTEHGNIYNWLGKKEYCEKHGIKYLHGCEVYLTKTHDIDNRERDNYHTILIAKNQNGFKELNKLISISTRPDHFYYKPRLSFDEFKNISSNIFKISACLASPLNKLRDESLIQYYDYLEVQPHINSPDQIEYNQWLYKMSLKYDKPLIAGTDTHSLNQYKAECRSILQKAKRIEFTNEDEFDLTFKSFDEIKYLFYRQNSLPEDAILSALNNTNVLAEVCEDIKVDTSYIKYPKMYKNQEEEEFAFHNAINIAYKNFLNRGIIPQENKQIYLNQIREEARVFKKVGMISFLMFMSKLIKWCHEHDIPTGFARGSCAGSLICYLLEIIDVDPIKNNLVFSRFCNENRVEPGDIDVDFFGDQREDVYNHIINEYGEEYTSYILALGTLAEKATIDEIGRALNIPLADVSKIKADYDINPDQTKKDYSDLFYYFDGMVGTCVSQSIHPAGMIVSCESLPDNYGIFYGSDGKLTLCLDMDGAHEAQLVKYDILGLKNVGIIAETCKLANITYPKSYEIDWNDQKVYEDMIKIPAGVFQFEGNYAFDQLKKFQPHSLADMSLINAALRPSGESYRDRLMNKEVNKNPSEIIDNLLKEEYGYLIFQENTIAFLQNICGFSGSEADEIRRAIGKKQKDKLDAAMPKILNGYCSKSDKPREIAEKEAKEFLQIIEDSSSYQFGKNHSFGYSMIGYMCAYLRYYYPEEFAAAYLNCAKNEDDIRMGTELCKIKNIQIFPPKFRHSKASYTIEKENHRIYKGLASIKYMNENIANWMFSVKDKTYDSFIDFITDFKQAGGNSKQLDILIQLDVFDEFGKSGKLTKIVELYNKFYNKKVIKKESNIIPEDYIGKFALSETDKQYKFTAEGMNIMLSDMCKFIENKSLPLNIMLKAQQTYMGYVDYVNPTISIYTYMVLDMKIFPSNPNKPQVTLYCLNNGKQLKVKVKNTALFKSLKFSAGSIVNIKTFDEGNKFKKDESGKWVPSGEKEFLMNSWEVVCA